jgi:hypothetical protein
MKNFLSKLPQLPAPLYLAFGIVLLLIVAALAAEYAYLTLQGKPVPDELKAFLFPALTALLGYLFSLKDQTTDDKPNDNGEKK